MLKAYLKSYLDGRGWSGLEQIKGGDGGNGGADFIGDLEIQIKHRLEKYLTNKIKDGGVGVEGVDYGIEGGEWW